VVNLKDFAKPPFSNYDLVVYFGCGLFVVPFVNRYVVEPFGLKWPTFKVLGAEELTSEVISALSLLVFVYIMGHMIAYLASQVIEKTIDRFLGKVSTAVTFLTVGRPGIRNSNIRGHIRRRVGAIAKDHAIVASAFRAALHIPALPVYVIIGIFGIFGYFNSRLSKHTVGALSEKIHKLDIPQIRLSPNVPWFKPMEYYVINRIPEAIPRMYNYLVIGGLFRSLSFIFLFAMWMILLHAICACETGNWQLKPLAGKTGDLMYLLEFLALQTLFVFSLFSYIKFQRRYAEEAIFAFLFERGEPCQTLKLGLAGSRQKSESS
jgi:hypothetical protein